MADATEHFETIAGCKTQFLRGGKGPTVLFLHGGGGAGVWLPFFKSLSENYDVIVPEHPGFGRSDTPPWLDNVGDEANFYFDFIKKLGLKDIHLIGNSLGGRIALQMATDQPDRITRMVLMGTPGVGMTPTEGLAALRAYEPSHDAMRALLRNYFAVDPAMITDDLVKIRYEASIDDGAYEAYRAMFFDPRHTGSDLGITENEVRAITTPTLLIHGREDKVVALQVSVTMLGLLPNADLHVFSACGHWTQVERADEFSAVVTDYLGRS